MTPVIGISLANLSGSSMVIKQTVPFDSVPVTTVGATAKPSGH